MRRWIVDNLESFEAGLGLFCLSWLVVAAGLCVGLDILPPSSGPHSPTHSTQSSDDFVNALTQWDGQWYLKIVQQGYSYRAKQKSSVAFFPGYPLLVAMFSKAIRIPPSWAALGISQTFHLSSFVLLYLYSKQTADGRREPAGNFARRQPLFTLLAFALFPPTLFFRMAYSESLFFL